MLKVVLLLLIELSLIAQITSQNIFQKTFGSINGNQSNSIILTKDSGYAIGGWYDVEGPLSAELYLIKLNSDGDTTWAYTYGEKLDTNAKNGSGNEGFCVIQTYDSGYLLTGEIHGFGAGSSDIYVVRVDINGDTLWSKTYGGLESEYGYSVKQMEDSGFVIAGYTESFGQGIRDICCFRIDKLGDTLWAKTFGGNTLEASFQIEKTFDGGLILVGYTFSFGAGNSDVYVIKIDQNGNIVWDKAYGGVLNDIGYSIVQSMDSGFVITGSTESFGAGADDLYLLKIDYKGNLLWSKTYGGEQFDGGYSVNRAFDDGFIVTGYSRSFGAGAEDVYLIRTNSVGDTIWTRSYGGKFMDVGRSVITAEDKGFVVAGYTQNFSSGNFDVYMIKTDSNGNSGCHQYATSTKVSDIATNENMVNTIVGSFGAIVLKSPTIVGKTVTKQKNPCDQPIGIDQKLSERNITIYPNPAENFLVIEFHELNENISMEIFIYDINGRIIQKKVIENDKTYLDLSNFKKGLYMIKIFSSEGNSTFKFIRQ